MFGKRKRDRPRRTRRVTSARKASGGLDAPDVIDQLTRGPNGGLHLVILHARPWTEGDDKRLKRKIRSYLGFIEHGQLDETAPEWFEAETLIDLSHLEPIPDLFLPVVEAMGEALVHRHGVGFITTTFVGDEVEHTVQRTGSSGAGPEGAMRGGTAFTMYVGEQLAAAGVQGLKLTDPWSLQTEGQAVSTERLWGECKGQGAEALAAEVRRWVESVVGDASLPAGEAPLIPLVRPREFTEPPADSLPPGTDPNEARFDLFTPLCGPLVICYAQDLGTRFAYVPKAARLTDLGLSPDDLPARAVENLRGALPELQFFQGEGTCIGVAAGGDYEASLLLLDDFCDDLAEQVAGELVACVPSRDLLFLTGSEDAAGLADLRQRVASAEIEPASQLWSELIVWRAGRWLEFDG